MSSAILLFGLVTFLVFLHMTFMWLWYRSTNNPSVVDVGWALGLTISGLVFLNAEPLSTRNMILSVLLFLWGLRLGLFLWLTRIRKGIVDKRYLTLSQDWKIAKPLGFFLNFQLQGFFILLLSLPWFLVALSPQTKPGWLDYAAVLLALVSLGAETLADYQLQVFKKGHPGKVCNQGLWSYSRHPNYFFEWLIWLSFSLFSFSHAFGWLGLISPLTLYVLMTRITGPMTEEGSRQARGQAYLDYQKNTPFFFPSWLNPYWLYQKHKSGR
ncbi:DUF1295 domain-containing protein [Legionella sp. MW5194]|uniref:DUF1295 domain-containing protein n=1 Tax=Legionella sp. MW5194 TaxID=2662448 RepID=UPI00193D0DB1|nr:DUF1295 domain-containing protein [Legionella sp. MW5194]QRN04030.1 DUF1295 domain-containing protein [Legionella sp. MW5194]